MIIFLAAFVIAVIAAIIVLISYLTKKKNCTAVVPATIIKVQHERASDGYGMGDYDGSIVYRPVFRYIYNGQEYIYRNSVAKTSYRGLQEGMTVNLMVNPKMPSEAVFVLDK